MGAVQYLTDNKGVRTSVVISIEDWKQLSKYISELKMVDQISESVQAGLAEALRIETGEVTCESTTDFLDAL